MIRLYVESSLEENLLIFLYEGQNHYIQNVMRLKPGDVLLLFNGREGEWKARITKFEKKVTHLIVLNQNQPQQTEGNLCLLFSPLKPKRQEFLIEKATELGISCLKPIRFQRTSLPKINYEKMRAQAREAAEQCGRLTVPHIKDLTSLSQLLKNWPHEELLIFGDESLTSPSIAGLKIEPQICYNFLVGPEGGFTAEEYALLKAHPQACGVTLNCHILRAETAAIVGISYLCLPK